MYKDDDLRQRVRILKATGQIDSYLQVAEMIDIKQKSFYNWLRGEYNLSSQKEKELREIVLTLWIPLEYYDD